LGNKVIEAQGVAKAFGDKLLYEKGIFLTPGAVFGSNGKRYMRLSLCASEEVLISVLKIVKQ
jgi:aspartate/methionine/tyrosine aminotransferase